VTPRSLTPPQSRRHRAFGRPCPPAGPRGSTAALRRRFGVDPAELPEAAEAGHGVALELVRIAAANAERAPRAWRAERRPAD
jgi:hypothetical protein